MGIANCFFRAGLIETWGRGTIKILNECKLAKVATPSFKYDLSGFIIEFKFKTLQQTIVSSNVELKGSTSVKVLQIITANPAITIPELATQVGVSVITIRRELDELQALKIIVREGSRKAGEWKVR